MMKRVLAIGLMIFLGLPVQAAVVSTVKEAGVFNILSTVPNQIRRYDPAARVWRAPVPLPAIETPRAMTGYSGGIIVAFDRSAYLYRLDGSAPQFLVGTSSSIREVSVLGNVLVVMHDAGVVTVNVSTGAVIGNANPFYRCVGASASPSRNRVYCRSTGISPADIVSLTFDSAGNFLSQQDSPHHGAYPDATRTWQFPDQNRVLDNAGIVYDAATLSYLGSLAGTFDDMVFVGDLPVLRRNGTVYAYSTALIESGTFALPHPSVALFADATTIYSFFVEPDGVTLNVDAIPLASFSAAQPGAPIDPTNLAYTPDAYAQDADDGVIYLLSKLHLSIFRWSYVQGRYLPTIPLAETPSYFSLDAANNRIYLAHPSGKIVRLDLASLQTQHIASLSTSPNGMAQAGEFVFLDDSAGAWDSHYTFDATGRQISAVEWNYFSREYVWSPANAKMYFFRDDTSPNDLLWEEINPTTGVIGNKIDSPYHGEVIAMHPIRVAPDGSVVVIGSGQIFNATTLVQIGSLPTNIADAAWLANGTLVTVDAGTGRTNLRYWSTAFAPTGSLQMRGAPIGVFAVGNEAIVLRNVGGRPTFNRVDLNNLPDGDNDGVNDYTDNCPSIVNANQLDLDGDEVGNVCDDDIDGDGMPNDFEASIGTNPLDPADAAGDPDLDRFDNVTEYGRGTDPRDAKSFPLPVENILIDFEDGAMPRFFRLPVGGPPAWLVDDTAGAPQGSHSLRTDIRPENSTAEIRWPEIFARGTLEFDVRFDGDTADRLDVYRDAVLLSSTGGNAGGWQHVTRELPSGRQTLRFVFVNQGSAAGTVRIDNIRLTRLPDPDADKDGVTDAIDNCPLIANVDQADTDADARGNVCDNCSATANRDQLDADGDLFGNACDADFNNDNIVNARDMGLLRFAMGTPVLPGSPFGIFDLNGDRWVNLPDLAVFRSRFGKPPGPSGLRP